MACANHGFLTLCSSFSPSRAKKELHKKKGAMLPQATAAFA
jgi:hypothetical protein